MANVAIGFTLFQTYTLTEDVLLRRRHAEDENVKTGTFTPMLIVAVAGAAAGAAQCIIAAPLDNMRLVLQRLLVRDVSKGTTIPAIIRHPLGTWRTILQAAILPFLPERWYHRLILRMTTPTVAREPKTSTVFRHLPHHLRLLSRRVHGISLMLSLLRDSAGFSCFFVSFECARRIAFHASLAVDNIVRTLRRAGPGALARPKETEEHGTVHLDFSFNASRTVYGRFTAALILVCGGAIGALLYELVSRPIEYVRMVLWYGLHVPQRPRSRAASAMGEPAKMRVPPHRQASVAYTVRPVRTMYPVPRVSHTQSVRRLRPLRRRVRLPHLLNSARENVVAAAAPHTPRTTPRAPREVRAMRARFKARTKRYSQSTIEKLFRYARLTAPPGSRATGLRLLAQTYLLRPFVYPELCKSSAPRPWGAAPPALPPPPTSLLNAMRPEPGSLGARLVRAVQSYGPRATRVAAPLGYLLNRVRISTHAARLAVRLRFPRVRLDGRRPRLERPPRVVDAFYDGEPQRACLATRHGLGLLKVWVSGATYMPPSQSCRAARRGAVRTAAAPRQKSPSRPRRRHLHDRSQCLH